MNGSEPPEGLNDQRPERPRWQTPVALFGSGLTAGVIVAALIPAGSQAIPLSIVVSVSAVIITLVGMLVGMTTRKADRIRKAREADRKAREVDGA